MAKKDIKKTAKKKQKRKNANDKKQLCRNINKNYGEYRITDNENGGTFIARLLIDQLIRRGHTVKIILDNGVEKTFLWKNISITKI